MFALYFSIDQEPYTFFLKEKMAIYIIPNQNDLLHYLWQIHVYALFSSKYLGTLTTFGWITTKSYTFLIDITLQPIH
jgi:hypothetical protein